MDVEITRWILEFLLRQPLSDYLVKKIITNIHVPGVHDDRRFKKTMILRSMAAEIREGSVSEKILESLETLEGLDREQGIKITDSMKAAYRAVAVECAVKYLGGSPQKPRGQGRFFEAVERIWRGRIGRLEKTELVTDDLKESRDEIEAAVWDSNSCKRLLERNTRNEALSLVRDYVEEAMAIMGPPFLVLLARTERELKEKAGRTANESNPCREVDVTENAATKEDQLETVPHKHKKVAFPKRHKGKAKIINSEELDPETAPGKYDILPSPEVNRVQESLKSSSMDLQAVVKDPLPDAIHLAETLRAQISITILNQEKSDENKKGKDLHMSNPSVASHEPLLENQNGEELVVLNPAGNEDPGSLKTKEDGAVMLNPAGDEDSGSLQTREDGDGMPSCSNQLDVSKHSLMERNSTARTYEWDDSIDDSPEGTSNHMNRVRLDSPKRKAVSPLKKYTVTKFAKRRKMKRWSLEEENALREGVQKFGRGSWKLILNSRRDIFIERTEVDLKDKWRNMTR